MRCSQIIKRFTLAALIAFSGAMLTGCGEDEANKADAAQKAEADAAQKAEADANIKIVKEAVLPIDKSRNIEEALTATLKDLSWKAYKTDYNQEIVEVNGIWRRGGLESNFRGNLVYEGDTVCLRFLINKDKTVNFSWASVRSNNSRDLDIFYFIPANEKYKEK